MCVKHINFKRIVCRRTCTDPGKRRCVAKLGIMSIRA